MTVEKLISDAPFTNEDSGLANKKQYGNLHQTIKNEKRNTSTQKNWELLDITKDHIFRFPMLAIKYA